MKRSRRAALAAALAAAAAAPACAVDRRLRIETDPPGAEVTVDGKYLGEAPLELHFAHYGERRFRISKRGYNTLDSVVPVEAPWYGAFPFDVFCEVVVPVWRTDYRSQSFTLTPRTEAAGLTDAELRRREEEAVGRARALARWVPGDPIPGASGPASSPDSRPTPAPPASKP